jgi:signal peptidase II
MTQQPIVRPTSRTITQPAIQSATDPAIHPHAMRKYYLLISMAVIVLDRVTKLWVEHSIQLHDSIRIIPGFFSFTHIENRGAAFGIFNDSPAPWKVGMLVAFSVLALVIVSRLLWKNSHCISSTGVGLALILGGAIGNLWDRVAAGHVTDFLLFYIGTHEWPAFNVADSSIVVGAALLVLEILFAKTPAEERVR